MRSAPPPAWRPPALCVGGTSQTTAAVQAVCVIAETWSSASLASPLKRSSDGAQRTHAHPGVEGVHTPKADLHGSWCPAGLRHQPLLLHPHALLHLQRGCACLANGKALRQGDAVTRHASGCLQMKGRVASTHTRCSMMLGSPFAPASSSAISSSNLASSSRDLHQVHPAMTEVGNKSGQPSAYC